MTEFKIENDSLKYISYIIITIIGIILFYFIYKYLTVKHTIIL